MRHHQINIPKIRETLGLTRAKLAERIGVDVSTISRWERLGVPERGTATALLNELAKSAVEVGS